MSQLTCCVPGCLVSVKDGITLHKFPNPDKYYEKFESWVSNIGGEVATMDNMEVFRNRRVCHRHFEEHHLYPLNRLCKIAIPVLHLQDQKTQLIIDNGPPAAREQPTPTIIENQMSSSGILTSKIEMDTTTKKGPVFESGECRCCGATKRCRLLNEQYEFRGQKEIYVHMFVDCFGLLLSHLDGDERERMICATCVTRLREAVDFRNQVLRCEEKLLLSTVQESQDVNTTCDQYKSEVKTELSPKAEAESEVNNEYYETDHLGEEQIEDDSGTDTQEPMRPPSCTQDLTDDACREPGKVMKVGKVTRTTKPMARNLMALRKQMLVNMKRTKEKLNRELSKEKTSDIVVLEGNRVQKSTKAFSNTVTIVENSYVCPFQSIFNNFYCDYCRQKFTDYPKLKEHCVVHDPSTFKDSIMDSMRRFGRKKTQLDIQRIDCRLCATPITDIETLKHHLTIVHGKTLYPVENEFLQFRITPSLECVECGQSFALFQALKKHMAEHFGTYTCHVCGTHFFNESYLIAHQKNHDATGSMYACEECGRTFKLKYSRDMHVSTQHKKEAAFQCIKCDETFFSSRLRFKHMMAVHGEVSTFHCTQCDRVYDNRRTLLDHMRRIHVTMLKHKCGICDRRFYLPSMLKDHMSTHTGEKNYKCDFCDKSYPRLKSLKVHLQSHAAVKKFKCIHCSASFGQNVSLKNHVKRQHQSLMPVLALNS